MIEPVRAALACPHCGSGFEAADGGLLCTAGHRFDLARQGYVNLLTGPAPAAADTTSMVAARLRVQAAGHHAPLTEALVRTVGGSPAPASHEPALIVDLGAGTGHHLAAVVDRHAGTVGLALDVSKHAARRAARAHRRVGAVVCDVWTALPVRDASVRVVLDVFAPRHVSEIIRILAPGGLAVVVTPTPEHLAPLVDRLGLLNVGEDKLERLDEGFASGGDLERREELTWRRSLGHDDLAAVVAMGPSAHHRRGPELAQRIAELPPRVEVTHSVTVSCYRRRS